MQHVAGPYSIQELPGSILHLSLEWSVYYGMQEVPGSKYLVVEVAFGQCFNFNMSPMEHFPNILI